MSLSAHVICWRHRSPSGLRLKILNLARGFDVSQAFAQAIGPVLTSAREIFGEPQLMAQTPATLQRFNLSAFGIADDCRSFEDLAKLAFGEKENAIGVRDHDIPAHDGMSTDPGDVNASAGRASRR